MTWTEIESYDDRNLVTILNDIQTMVGAVASAKGILSDLRVTPTGTVTVGGTLTTVTTVTTVTTCSTVTTVTNINNLGGLALGATIPNWQNQTYSQSFTNNIVRA